MAERITFLYGRILSNKHKMNEENRKSPLDKHHSNNCYRQDPPKDAKINGWKSETHYRLKESSPKIFVNYTSETSHSTMQKPGRRNLTDSALTMCSGQ